MPTLTLIYVTYNSAATIRAALDSALALHLPPNLSMRVVVVDNASQDGTPALITAYYPQVQVLVNPKNVGFAAANNLAMQRFPAAYFGLVNADVRLAEAWAEALSAAFESDPQLGVAGSKIFFGESGILQHAGAGVRPNGLTYHIGTGERDEGQHDQPRAVDYVMGAAFMVRGDLAAALGYLHTGYFMYFEETELCAQARRLGYAVRYVPTAVAYHDERHSLSGKPSLKYLWRYHRSRYLFAARNLDPRTFCAAEQAWLRGSARDVRYRALLHTARLSQVRLWLRHRWLLTLRA
ncbi:MAG: glycosyltransferase family 2 protein [Chloroflexi bacterium CFX4]|nr:glycosyltransferase family 2 protein [Chloroflexi bacterium CFX4]MDL1924560.1 glycosyltransferase family 2 protein [Chloroflexi bacterium CFX3]